MNIILPELGEGIKTATIACWHHKPGEQIQKDDDLLEVVTDKATFNISAPADGTLREVMFKDGQEAKIGDTLAVLTPKK